MGEQVTVCPYCGVPNPRGKAVCTACGNDLEPNRVVFDPVSSAWQMGRGIRRRPVTGEPMGHLVRGGLLVIGLTFSMPSLFGIIKGLYGMVSGQSLVGTAEAVVISGLWALVGGVLCYRAIRRDGLRK